MSKDVSYKYAADNQQSRTMVKHGENIQDDKKTLAKKGWAEKGSSFNKTETDNNNCSAEVISRSINKFLKSEKTHRPTANPTKVCLKPEILHESKEQFAQRIRQAWIDREQSKSSLNIYLARNVIEDHSSGPGDLQTQESLLIQGENNDDSGRTALEVQLQGHRGDGENSQEESVEEDKPLSAAARRVRFYKTAKQQKDRQTLIRAMSAPSTRQQIENSAQGHYSTTSRRKSQDIHKFSTRKLKSCRSKAFHKSIDLDNHPPNGKKYCKQNQHVEVVTMMSLLSPVGSDAEEPIPSTPNDVSTKTVTFPQFSNNMRFYQKSFDSAIQSIEKPKLFNNRVGKSLIKSKTFEISKDEKDDDDERRSADEVVITGTECRDETVGEIAVRRGGTASDGGQPMFESDKEKECWALFKKMTAKGVSVTFDTVLRGMLTPTEYRLRKNQLLLFG